MFNFVGFILIEYVFYYLEMKEIVIVGLVEGFYENVVGCYVGLVSGKVMF